MFYTSFFKKNNESNSYLAARAFLNSDQQRPRKELPRRRFSFTTFGYRIRKVSVELKGLGSEDRKDSSARRNFGRKKTLHDKIGSPKNFVHLSHIGPQNLRSNSDYFPISNQGMAIIDESASLISKNYVISQNTSRRSVLCADNEDINIGRSISSISKLDGRLGEENLNSTDFEERSLSMLLNEFNRGPEKRGAAYQTSSKRPPSHRIKPKVVPIYIASASGDVLLVKPREEMHTLIEIQNEKSEEEKNCEDEAQLDLKGKHLHCVGGEYMTNTVKLKWDFKMQEVSKALKED